MYMYLCSQGKVAEKRALDRSRSVHARVRYIEMVSEYVNVTNFFCIGHFLSLVKIHNVRTYKLVIHFKSKMCN